MTLLSTLYASAPADEVMIPTLEISHPSFVEPIRTCAGFEDHTVTVNVGELAPARWATGIRSPHELD